VTEHWHRLARESVSLHGDIQKPPRFGHGQPALGGSASAGRLDKMTFRGPFQPQPFCDSE